MSKGSKRRPTLINNEEFESNWDRIFSAHTGDNQVKYYRKKLKQPMRPYVPGEDLTGVSVNKEDTPEEGGMIAFNPDNLEDQWYVAKKFFEENYEEV